MAARLGNVLFWLGIIIAIGWALLCYFLMRPDFGRPFFDPGAATFVVLLVSVPSFLIGWALRYILRGN